MQEGATSGDPVAATSRSTAHRRLLRYALPSLAAVGGVGALELLRSWFQRHQVFRPQRFPDGLWHPGAYDLPAEDVWFPSEGGVELHGWWMPHRRAKATLVYCHGQTGNITTRVQELLRLRRLRMNLLAFDYRGYGRSSGEPTEQGLFADARAAVDYLTGERRHSLEAVILFGHSMGGAVAIDAALHRPVAGLVAQSSFTDLKAMAKVAFPGLPMHWVTRNQFRSLSKVGRLTMPKLFIHGTADMKVPLQLGRKLYEAAAEPKRWLEVPRADHNDVHLRGGLRYRWELARFRDRCLRDGPVDS